MSNSCKRPTLDSEDRTAIGTIETTLKAALLVLQERLVDHADKDNGGTITATIEVCTRCDQPHVEFQVGKYGKRSHSLVETFETYLEACVKQKEAIAKYESPKKAEPVMALDEPL